jgi:CheY-like chemotaxis protein/HPt (histidine-containing phosphotransfer) domain-containing protein
VDDNSTNRRILSEMLQYWQMQPVLADSAAAARKAMQHAEEAQSSIRLILLDHHMPGEDGFHFAASVRDMLQRSQCPIIMISSGSSAVDAETCQKYGIGRFMNKPVIASELLNEVLRQFGRFTTVRPETPSTAATPSDVQPRRVLLVEDNEINRRVALGLLRSRRHQVLVAENGQVALNLLAEQEFDVVLMDMQMPVMGGEEATAEIRKREIQTGGHIPIVAMTAEALKGDRERFLDSGMDDYVSKPIVPAEMYRAVERFPALCLPAETGARNSSESDAAPSEKPSKQQKVEAPAKPTDSERRLDPRRNGSPPVIDWKFAETRLAGGREMLLEFVELVGEETPKMAAEICRAIEISDSKLLRRAAHTLKGSASYFGAEALVQAALALENLGRAESFDGATEMLAALEKELARFRDALMTVPAE